MKKSVSLMLALLLALALIPAAAEAPVYTGTWALTGMTVGGMTIAADALEAELILTLNEDGTCTLNANGRSETGSWTADEDGVTVTDAAGASGTLVPTGSTLSCTRGDATLILSPAVAPVTVRAGLSASDFNGRWELHHLEMAQGVIMQESMVIDMIITLQDGQGTVTMIAGDEETYACECETRELNGLGTAFYCFFLDPATNARTGSGLALLLFSDGQLVWLDSDSTGDYYYCFQLAAAQ